VVFAQGGASQVGVGAGVAKALPLAVLYTLYPPTPFGYKTWTKLTQKVWDSVGQMSDLYA
jgi:hypothetical protein